MNTTNTDHRYLQSIEKNASLYNWTEDREKEFLFYDYAESMRLSMMCSYYNDPIILGELSIIKYTKNAIITAYDRNTICMIRHEDHEELLLEQNWIKLPLDLFYSSLYGGDNRMVNQVLQEVILLLSIRDHKDKNIWFEAKDEMTQRRVESYANIGAYSFSKRIIKF